MTIFQFLPPAYEVREKVIIWHVSVCLSVCLSAPGRYPHVADGGCPHLCNWGYPHPAEDGTSIWLMGVPHLADVGTSSDWHVPPSRSGPRIGGVPPTRTIQYVLDTRRAVCLLRSCRRTFLSTKCWRYLPFCLNAWPLTNFCYLWFNLTYPTGTSKESDKNEGVHNGGKCEKNVLNDGANFRLFVYKMILQKYWDTYFQICQQEVNT